ncbi:ribonuclease HII [Shewanella sp. UCD-FRSSP16_17]|uniref:ribonuclease HII n=1 Tax=Shewanella sp. UCD-FRSSP16_17 TaxID=1853256 RepID=UPI0007EECF29|nr:ribonuclease HII [Shewanella sp. UCD-FRSSP16_17]OBT09177.1 ribonuclease HII [Shewanella sp. UCD-FRSSP16_17]
MSRIPTVIKGITPEQVAYITRGVVAGVDEVGRGPLVGDVVTAAVILDPNQPIAGLNDSKKLSEKRRELLFNEITDKALAISVGRATPTEIDDINILHATMLAMQRAVAGLSIQPEKVLVDGNRTPDFGIQSHAIIKGDGLVAAISAASIIAKVTRDREMDALDARYPQYGFANHKGYPTKAHYEALEAHGVLPEHRKSFKPVMAILNQS